MPSSSFIESMSEWLRQDAPSRLFVGYSGGLDSSVLLHALAEIPEARAAGLTAIHIDHQIHPRSHDWEAHCAAVCRLLDVALASLRVEVDRGTGLGKEGAARAARFRAFASLCPHDSVLALAHHQDDQAETLLLRLLRSAGTGGLGAMSPTREHAQLQIWRPLLDTPKSALRDWARAHGLTWIEDPSNADPCLDRNFLRHRVLPILREHWPKASAALAGSAGHLRNAAITLAELAQVDLAAVRGLDPASLRRAALATLPAPRQCEVLRAWLDALGAPAMPRRLLSQLPRLLLEPIAPDIELRWKNVRCYVHRDALVFTRTRQRAGNWVLKWDGTSALSLPGGFGDLHFESAAPLSPLALEVRPRRGGEKLRLPGRRHFHQLKDCLHDLGIPRHERERLPLLFRGNELVAAGDLLISASLQKTLVANGARLVWVPGEGAIQTDGAT